jgi:hypothetical protein
VALRCPAQVAGAHYAPTALLIPILGLTIGAAQTLGSLLMIASGAWVAWSVVRRSPDEVVGGEARPRVQ